MTAERLFQQMSDDSLPTPERWDACLALIRLSGLDLALDALGKDDSSTTEEIQSTPTLSIDWTLTEAQYAGAKR